MQKIFTTVAMALAAMAAVVATTSCSDDDDMLNLQNGSEMTGDMNTRSVAFNGNPEDLAENQHAGAQIVKKVAGYGDSVVFTCLTDKAPFYFVHVSDRDYSASEMDAMKYQQNSMVPDQETLSKLAKATQDFTYSVLGETKTNGYNGREWRISKTDDAKEALDKVFPGWQRPYFDLTQFDVETAKFWYRNAVYDYPFARIWTNAYSYRGGDNGYETDYHNFYISTKPHRLMFYVLGHSQSQEDTDALAPASSCHLGGKVTKTIDNYGEAEFVCVSEQAPYYFVHVSDNKISAAKMDAMQFQQNPYAVTYDLLEGISQDALKLAHGILTNPAHDSSIDCVSGCTEYYYSKAECDAVCNKLNPYFKHLKVSSRRGIFLLENVWVKYSDESYPYGWFYLDFSLQSIKPVVCNDGAAAGHSSYMCYKTADDNYAMFAFKVE